VAARLDVKRWVVASGLAALAWVFGLVAGIEPKFTLVAAAGLAFVLLAFVDLTAAVVVFMVGAFLEYLVVAGPVLSFPKLGGLILGLAWLARIASRGHQSERTFFSEYPIASALLGGFLAWALLSLAWSEDIGASFGDLYRYALNAVLFLIVFSAVQTRKQAEVMFGGFILGALIAAAYGIVTPPAPEADEFREAGAIGSPNELAAVLIAGAAFAIGAAIGTRRTPLFRMALIGIATFCLLATFLTASRSAMIALAACLLAAVLVGGRARLAVLGMSVLIAFGALTYLTAFAPAEVRDRITETLPGQAPSTEGRFTIWQVGWRMVEDQPLVGVGVGNFRVSSIHYLDEPGSLARTDFIIDDPRVAHSIYLQILAELGLIGVVLFFSLIAFCAGSAIAAAQQFARLGDRLMEAMSRALVVALVNMLVIYAFQSGQFSKVLWILLALGPSMMAIARSRSRSSPEIAT